MSNPFTLRRDFMQRFDMSLPATPQFDAAALAMWQTMLQEEWQEFMTALQDYRQLPQTDTAEQTRLRAELAGLLGYPSYAHYKLADSMAGTPEAVTAKVTALEAAGITVSERVPHQLPENPHNARYLATKRDRSGHLLI